MSTKKPITAKRTVLVSTLVSLSDIFINVFAAVITGSVVLLAQALQGFADLTATVLLLVGVKRSQRKANETHPFGFGRELFFWVLISSLFTFMITGGLALYQGIQQVLQPSEITNVAVVFLILIIGIVSNGYSLSLGLRRMRRKSGKKGVIHMLLHSSLIETKMSMLVDFMGTLSAILGLIAIGLFTLTDDARFDGLGAVSIGALTAIGALFVINDLRGLIVGRSPSQDAIRKMKKATLTISGVLDILELHAVVVGSGQILVIIEAHFDDDFTTDEIEQKTDAIKEAIIKAVPQVVRVQVESETPDEELVSTRHEN